MSKKDEALKLALEAAYLAGWNASGEGYNAEYPFGDYARNPEEDAAWIKDRDNALREALAEQPAQQYNATSDHRLMEMPAQEPEFFTHCVDKPYDWSEWVCPNPKSYLMKCCDCGLVHEAEFGVVRYKSETEREDCDMVDDPNLQAVFRMRRSEQWSPADMAHRAGGLTMEQPAQQEPVWDASAPLVMTPHPAFQQPAQQEPVAWIVEDQSGERLEWASDAHSCHGVPTFPLYTTPPQRKPLTEEQVNLFINGRGDEDDDDYVEPTGDGFGLTDADLVRLVRRVEAAHGIKENT